MGRGFVLPSGASGRVSGTKGNSFRRDFSEDPVEEAGELSHEEKEEYSKKLSEAFGRMKGKMSFCPL